MDDWFISRNQELHKVVGIDLNVSNFSTDSDGLVVDHPKERQEIRKEIKETTAKTIQKNREEAITGRNRNG